MATPTIPNGEEHFFNIVYSGNGTGQTVGNFVPFNNNGTIAKSVMYMADEGEVRSHAKEAAYYTYKMLPGVTTFDYNKLLTAGVKEEDLHKYHIYAVKFLDDTWRNDLITKHNLNPGISQTMIDAGNKFLSYVQRYLAHSFKVAQQQGINQQDQPTHGAATPSLIAQHKAQLPQAPQAPLDTGSSI